MTRRWLVLSLLLTTTLIACGGGGVRKRVFPPSLSVQELSEQADGAWALKLRLQNFSNVSMRFDQVQAELTIDGVAAGSLSLQPALVVGPEGAEIVNLAFVPSSEAASRVRAALEARRSLRYAVNGTIRSSEPDERGSRRDEFSFESQLSAVPGLAGVLR